MESRTVNVPSISCGHCVNTIEREVGEVNGVVAVKAEAESKTVTVEWKEPACSWDAIQSLLAEIGFPPEA